MANNDHSTPPFMYLFKGLYPRRHSQTTPDKSTSTLASASTPKLTRSRSNTRHAEIIEDFPRIIEQKYNSSVESRSQCLHSQLQRDRIDIGPADLVHITLSDPYHNTPLGQYFHLTGLDCSNDTNPLAFLRLITSSLSTQFDNVVYCSYNLFAKQDVRIHFESMDVYQVSVLDFQGTTWPPERVALTEQVWDELFVSAMIRSVLYNWDKERQVAGLVQLPLMRNNLQRIVKLVCQFVPRFAESGWDNCQSVYLTILDNYLIVALLQLLKVSGREIVQYTLDYLMELASIEETSNDDAMYYKIVRIAIMDQTEEMDVEMIRDINELLIPLLTKINDSGSNRDARGDRQRSLQLINSVAVLLNFQAKFLINQRDYEKALAVSSMSTSLSSDTFNSWYYLSLSYISLGRFDKALYAINSMPFLPEIDSIKLTQQASMDGGHYVRPKGMNTFQLEAVEFDNLTRALKNLDIDTLKSIIFGRVVMPNRSKRGCIGELWSQSLSLIHI